MTAAKTTQTVRGGARLLVAEDDVKLSLALRRGLEHEGYDVDLARSGDSAIEQAAAHEYDAVVLDVMLPGVDGFTVCETLRRRERWVPVLMLTALGDVGDRVRGLDRGADDYLVKPFAFDELLARLRALTRRGPSDRPSILQVGAIAADRMRRNVSWPGGAATLTPREFELLELLLRRAGDVISRAQLLQIVWGKDYAGSHNVVDVYIGYLRRKLEAGAGGPEIRTVRGVGFALELP